MGVLIEGDPRKGGKRYTIAEISRATGIKRNTLHTRRSAYKIPASGAYSYDEVKQLIAKPLCYKHKPRQEAINELRALLRKDGML